MRFHEDDDDFNNDYAYENHGYDDEDVFRGEDGEYHTYDEYGDVNDLW